METKAAKEQQAGRRELQHSSRRAAGEPAKETKSRVKGKEELQTGSTLITMLQKSLTAELHGTGLQRTAPWVSPRLPVCVSLCVCVGVCVASFGIILIQSLRTMPCCSFNLRWAWDLCQDNCQQEAKSPSPSSTPDCDSDSRLRIRWPSI